MHRGGDPVAARYADQWETVFTREHIDVDDVRANAPAALAASDQQHRTAPGSSSPAELAQVAGELAAAEVATGAVAAGTVDVAAAQVTAAETAEHSPAASAAGTSRWSRTPTAPPPQPWAAAACPAHPTRSSPARETPDLAATAPQWANRAVELVRTNGLDQ